MKKRKFLKTTALLSGGTLVAPSLILSACKGEEKKEDAAPVEEETAVVAATSFTLPEIPYGYDAFPDVIDAMTMEIHHSKHHAGYTRKLNAALKENAVKASSIEEILMMDDLPHIHQEQWWRLLQPCALLGYSDSWK